jgi:MFS family permease
MVVGLALVLAIRPDPKEIAAQWHDVGTAAPAAPLREILRRAGVRSGLVGAISSFAVMVGVMNLTGYVVVGHGHHQADVFDVISAHIVGMYALVLVIGSLIDRFGRRPAVISGLAVMAVSCLGLVWAESVLWSSAALFGLGLGWNISYVGAATILADAASPAERGKLLGFTDLVSSATGAALALIGGVAYTELGITALALGATALVVLPGLWILLQSAAGGRSVRPLSVS